MNQVIYSNNQGFQNNYTFNGYFDYDNNYDFDCDEQQYEYTDAAGRPYLETAIPVPSLFYIKQKIEQQNNIMRQLVKEKKQKEAALAARRAVDEARWQAEEAKFRKEQQRISQLGFLRTELNKLTLQEVGKVVRENVYTDEAEVKIATEVLLSKLPKFPASTLERMKKEEEEKSKPMADRKFYTWLAGNKASVTSHTAWGSRRNGGKNQGKENLQVMNSDAYIQRVAARRVRRKLNAEKEAEEQAKRSETIARINSQIAAAKAESETPPATSPIEETEYQKFKREEIESFRVKTIDISYETSTREKSKPVEEGWKKVAKVDYKKEKKVEQQLTQMFYEKKPGEETVISKVVEKVSWTNAKKATLMCKSVINGGKCPHPPGKCNFAHSPEELCPKNCINPSCRFIKRIGSKYINKGGKVCAYLHEGETKSNLCSRIGMKIQEVVCKPVIIERINMLHMTPLSTRVLKPYSATQAWGPVI